MLKRLIGVIGTLCVVAVIAWTILSREKFKSAINLERQITIEYPTTEPETKPLDTANYTEESREELVSNPDSLHVNQ